MKEKFINKLKTAKGEDRASVRLTSLESLWFNTGTLCNLECKNCYIESSPKNDRLSYLETKDVTVYLDEIKSEKLPTSKISFTGGEPFLNPNMIEILSESLKRGFETLVLTNAYRVIKRVDNKLLALKDTYGDSLKIRVSLDHYTKEVHEEERGAGTLDNTMENIKWFFDNGFSLSIAGRSLTGETDQGAREGYAKLLKDNGVEMECSFEKLVIFPEMNAKDDVPEITTACWGILGKSPDDMMCATERMIVRRKEHAEPVVLPCTLLAYDPQFELGNSLKTADKDVYLNHKFCAEFCVLGGASCSSTN